MAAGAGWTVAQRPQDGAEASGPTPTSGRRPGRSTGAKSQEETEMVVSGP